VQPLVVQLRPVGIERGSGVLRRQTGPMARRWLGIDGCTEVGRARLDEHSCCAFGRVMPE
jgi:hypothetical protein